MTFAVSVFCRPTPERRPNSIWAMTGQTEPGTYLPNWLTKTCEAAKITTNASKVCTVASNQPGLDAFGWNIKNAELIAALGDGSMRASQARRSSPASLATPASR